MSTLASYPAGSTWTEGSNLDRMRHIMRDHFASAGLSGGNMGLTVGGSVGSGCAVCDAVDSQELRLRGYTDFNASGSRAFQHGNPR